MRGPARTRRAPGASVENGLEIALGLLARRERSTRELELRLASRGLDSDAIRETVGRLQASGLLDDSRYALERAAALAERGAGDALIRAELRRCGIARDVVDEALARLEPEQERAYAIVERRGRTRRTLRFLRSKGFDEELVASLVADELGEELR